MKSLKVITYCTWTSPGSILQALGLKKALLEIGCQSTILLDQRDNEFGHVKIHSLKSALAHMFETIISNKRKSAYQKRIKFICDHIDIEYFDTYEELSEIAAKASSDYILAGSDQIWNPDKCSPVFFLDFAKNKKRISYAASMGKTEISVDKEKLFERLINNFDLISVREEECADVIQSYIDKEISRHIDPTFLVSAETWREYEKPYASIPKGPYILLYMLYWDNACIEKIKKLKCETGLPVYAITNGLTRASADKYLYDVGIEEFLWLIDHAEYVITSSFHGVAFSTIFNKKYASVVNPSSPSRIRNLMKILSVPSIDISDLNGTEKFRYGEINEAIRNEREKSIQYLKKAIES